TSRWVSRNCCMRSWYRVITPAVGSCGGAPVTSGAGAPEGGGPGASGAAGVACGVDASGREAADASSGGCSGTSAPLPLVSVVVTRGVSWCGMLDVVGTASAGASAGQVWPPFTSHAPLG